MGMEAKDCFFVRADVNDTKRNGSERVPIAT